MVSSNVVQQEKPETHIDRTNEVQREIVSSHNNGKNEENLDEEQGEDQEELLKAPTILAKPFNYPSTFGHDVLGRILGEIVDSFIIKRARDPPQIPLCRLMENEVIRVAGPRTEGLSKI